MLNGTCCRIAISAVVGTTIAVCGGLLTLRLYWRHLPAEVPQTRMSRPGPGRPGTCALDSQCGPYSLCIALNRLGVPAEVDDLIRRCDSTGQGTSLGDLRRIAEEAGVPARIAVLSWEQLVGLDGTAILFTTTAAGPHFVAVDPREGGAGAAGHREGVRVYDSEKAAQYRSRQDLESVWPGGQCLILNKRSRAGTSEAGRIELDTAWLDIGNCRSTDDVAGIYRLQNTGGASLSLEVVGTSCGCTSFQLERKTILSGETCNLTMSIDLRTKRGQFTEYLVIRSSDAALPMFRVFLRGHVLNERLTSTDVLYFGEMFHDSERSRVFVVHDPGEGKLAISDVRMLLADGEERVEAWATYERIEEVTESYTGIRSRFPIREGDYLVTVYMHSCTEPGNTGVFTGTCRVLTTLEGEMSQCDVRLSGTVQPDIQANPAALVLSYVPWQARKREIHVSSRSGRPVALRAVHVEGDLPVSATFLASENAGAHSVTITLQDERAESRHTVMEGTVVCETDLGNLAIPVVVVPTAN